MENQKKISLYFILYLVGVIAGLGLTLLATWGDLEAAFYGFDRVGGLRLSSLSCPILMSDSETSSFSIRLSNSIDRKWSPSVKINISAPGVPISSSDTVPLEPGQSKKLEWNIGPENIDLGRFVFIRAWVYASYPQPDRESTCGVVIHPFGMSGMIITWGLVIVSLLGIGIGLYGLKQAGGLAGGGAKAGRYHLLTILVVAGLVTSFMGIWLAGVLVLTISLLVSVISAGFSVKL